MTDQTNTGALRLHRVSPGAYRFDSAGEGYKVLRQTDGTLGSAVIWDVQRESDRKLVASFTTLADLRGAVRTWPTQEDSDG